MTTYVVIKGQRFEVLGPVDRRRRVEFTPQGRALCPYCLDGGRQVGHYGVIVHADHGPSFNEREKGVIRRFEVRSNHHFTDHLKAEHYRCTKRGCGWIGAGPGQHVVRSEHHHGPVVVPSRPRPPSIRISDLGRTR